MRVAVGITVPGAGLLIAGLLTGSAGEVFRLAYHRGWQPLANAAAILLTGALLCGVTLLAVVGWWWGLTGRSRRHPVRRLASGPGRPPVRPSADAPGGPAGPAGPPVASAVQAGGPGHGTADAGMAGMAGAIPPGAGPPGPDPAEQKLVELRDLYRAAGEMSDAALRQSRDELTRRQEELIRGYFEVSRAWRGGQPGARRLPRLPGRSSR